MTAAAGLTASVAAPRIVFAQAAPAPAAPAAAPAAGPFVLPPLTYAPNALEPHIDAKTMEIHHGRHHQAFITNLNNLVKTNPQLGTTAVENILGNINALDDSIKFAVRNNLGGHANHTMFWQIMGPDGGKPEGEVLAAIDRDLGGMEKFQTEFNAAGGRQFGSGWAWLQVKGGKLEIAKTPNGENPLVHGAVPILGVDVWEHSYYIDYRNRRPDYLKAFVDSLVNWDYVDELFGKAG